MADLKSPPLYDLTTDDVRPIIRIDGAPYELRMSRDLSLIEYKALERDSPRMALLLGKSADLSQTENDEMEGLLDKWCRRAIIAPDAVHVRLGIINRLHIWNSFTELLTPRLSAARAMAQREANQNSGENSSPNSPGSTEARRNRGSKKSRSARSGRT